MVFESPYRLNATHGLSPKLQRIVHSLTWTAFNAVCSLYGF